MTVLHWHVPSFGRIRDGDTDGDGWRWGWLAMGMDMDMAMDIGMAMAMVMVMGSGVRCPPMSGHDYYYQCRDRQSKGVINLRLASADVVMAHTDSAAPAPAPLCRTVNVTHGVL